MRELMVPDRLSAAITAPGGPWREVEVLAELGSTNAHLLRDPRPGRVVVTEHQVSGRGRLDRGWQTPPAAAVTMSAAVEAPSGAGPLGWLPLLVGLAVRDALARACALAVALKWPNDVLAAGGGNPKLCGILCELAPAAPVVVVGIGLNVDQERTELPVDTATSLRLLGVPGTDTAVCRERVAAAVLGALAETTAAWQRGGDPLRTAQDRYRDGCLTLGSRVAVLRPVPGDLHGEATGIDEQGRLVVSTPGGPVAVAAGDVVHVRPGPQRR